VAEKAKTAQKSDALRTKRSCPVCGAESKVVQYAGFGQMKGFFWVCDKNPEHVSRTR
jgi:ssDNA-binding Zn-finger/Zn-ribbon topoisomerase 1